MCNLFISIYNLLADGIRRFGTFRAWPLLLDKTNAVSESKWKCEFSWALVDLSMGFYYILWRKFIDFARFHNNILFYEICVLSIFEFVYLNHVFNIEKIIQGESSYFLLLIIGFVKPLFCISDFKFSFVCSFSIINIDLVNYSFNRSSKLFFWFDITNGSFI